jgi:small metal-binding protein
LAAEDHIAEAITPTKQAIDHGKMGHADVLTTHAGAALTYAQAGEKAKANPHCKEALKHLEQTIARDGERLAIAFSDPYGRLEAVTHPLSETVAYIEPTSPLVPLHAALTLALDDARVTGFRVNTARTRDLVFNGGGKQAIL